MKRSVKELEGIHQGEDIWVLGCASSMKYMSASFFEGRTVIGVNRIYEVFPCQYVVGKDLIRRDLHHNHKLVLSARRCGAGKGQQIENGLDFDQDWYCFEHFPNQHIGIDWDALDQSDKLIVSYSTITSAMHLACRMGAAAVFMCGIDSGFLDGELRYTEQPNGYDSFLKDSLPTNLKLMDVLMEQY